MLAGLPNRKRATAYLEASGAAAISIFLGDQGNFTLSTASKITGIVAARWWITEQDVAPVARAVRTFAGRAPDLRCGLATGHADG
jgi:hypothetical protein